MTLGKGVSVEEGASVAVMVAVLVSGTVGVGTVAGAQATSRSGSTSIRNQSLCIMLPANRNAMHVQRDHGLVLSQLVIVSTTCGSSTVPSEL